MPGLQELLVIGVVALIVFGPDRLPEVARNAGKMIARVRSETSRNVSELGQLSELQELRQELGQLRRELDGAARDVRREAKRAVGGPSATGARRTAVGGATSAGATAAGAGAAGVAGAAGIALGTGRLPARPAHEPAPFDPDTT